MDENVISTMNGIDMMQHLKETRKRAPARRQGSGLVLRERSGAQLPQAKRKGHRGRRQPCQTAYYRPTRQLSHPRGARAAERASSLWHLANGSLSAGVCAHLAPK